MHRQSNFPKFMLLWAGEFISAIGGGLTSFGLGVYVFGQTGSAGSMALVPLLAFLPTLLLGVPAGVLADRYDRRLLMMLGDGCSALGILYILVCMMGGGAALWQICLGVFVSSAFSALLEPSYRATVADLLTKEEYSKASGLVSLAGSARYLISPALAGALLAFSDIKLLLAIDICTFFPTVLAAAVVRRNLPGKTAEQWDSFMDSLRQGWQAVTGNRGIQILIMVSAALTCFMGTFQILAQPLILDFADSATLGIGETVCACGMLASSLFLGIRGIRRGYVRKLILSLLLAGICMVGFGVWENIYSICLFGFLFFATLPFANNCLDCLVRTNIADELQGRAWGLIGFLSQIGYAAAYGTVGAAADGIAAGFHMGIGRSAARVVIAVGALLGVTSLALYFPESVRNLESQCDSAPTESSAAATGR